MDRPEKIPAHTPVPNTICAECHEQPTADSAWKRISATAGPPGAPPVGLRSGSADVLCLDCHAREVHAFKAVDVGLHSRAGATTRCTVRLGADGEPDRVALHHVPRLRPLRRRACGDGLVAPGARPRAAAVLHLPRDAREARGARPRQGSAPGELRRVPQPARPDAGGRTPSRRVRRSGCHANADTLTAFHRGLGVAPAGSSAARATSPTAGRWSRRSASRAIATSTGIVALRAPAPPRDSDGADHGPRCLASPRAARAGAARGSGARMRLLRAAEGGRAPRRTGGARRHVPFQHGRHRKVACVACHDASRQHAAITVQPAPTASRVTMPPTSAPVPARACHATCGAPVGLRRGHQPAHQRTRRAAPARPRLCARTTRARAVRDVSHARDAGVAAHGLHRLPHRPPSGRGDVQHLPRRCACIARA